jgi:tRNA (uracil-5-)-methyltransferase TRM9
MDYTIVERLLSLNREFYTTFARPFAGSRPVSDPALTCILPHIGRCARVLDVGCGNGRLALLLDQERPDVTYLGVDVVPGLIEIARAKIAQFKAISAEFHVADITRPGWDRALADEADRRRSGAGFDCVVALAVLHHLPSFDLRARVMRDLFGLLDANGCLILSTWQFLGSARMRRKIVDWEKAGVSEEVLEPGDYLLDWKRGGRGLRYCHLVDRAEVDCLAAESGFRVRETFRAGGREGNLSLFAVLDPV